MTVYSANGEDFCSQDISGCIDSIEINIGQTITLWEGEEYKPEAADFLPRSILEQMCENAYELHGEYSEDWPDCNASESSLDEYLIKATNDWADKHNQQPCFYGVKNLKMFKIRITSLDGDYEVVK